MSALVAVLAVLGGTVWWTVMRGQGESARGRSGVPGDAIALINSSTPLPSIVPSGPKDAVGDLSYKPQSDGWSAALGEAYRALEEGRYSAAISQFSALVGDGTGADAREALWGLAAAYWEDGQPDSAIRAYTIFSELDDPRSPRAVARIAHIYEQTGREQEAVSAYDAYIQRAGPARHAIMLMKARLLGATQAAEDVYKAVVDDKPADIDLRDALLAWADVKSRRGDHKGAMGLYDRLAALQTSDPRPLLDNYGLPAAVHAANEAKAAGDTNLARTRLLAYIKGECGKEVAACPYYAYGIHSAIDALLKIEPSAVVSGTVDAMQAARVAYESGYYSLAIGFLDDLRQRSPNSPDLAEASLLTGKAYQSSGAYDSAYNWYTATVQTYPTSTQAAEANRRAGDTLRDQSLWDEAMGAYQQTAALYPSGGDETVRARVNGGVLAYRLEQREVALGLLQPVLLVREVSPTLKSNTLFWIGKVQKGLSDASWRNSISQVPALDPGSFYAFRAQSLLDGESDGGPLALTAQESGVTADELGVHYDREAPERDALLTWAAGLGPRSEETPGATRTATQEVTPSVTATRASTSASATVIEGVLVQDPEMLRAASLFQLGFEAEAYTSYRILAERLRDKGDGVSLAQLVIYLRYNSNANIAMRVSELLADMDAGDPLKRPSLLLKIMYPTPFEGLVLQETAQRELDPLVLYALMRQESQFIPAARSHADARGLTQVIPSTGEGIAEQLGDTSFSASDLYLPYVNLRYGTYYLASNLPTFDRKLLPGLAAYNGGPGNADRWLAGSALIDPDLFVERIDLFETEDYLRKVYQNYGFYRAIYGR
jgi:soluble lytic murein transglycosylase